ncbi:MAG: MarR family transcriptional regulator [Actinomycetota bacterium]|nr:MarR family transcriptional regulator [Actinomycetota bacterium]
MGDPRDDRMGSAFDPSSQHYDVDKKLVAALERISQAYRVLLQEEAQGRGLSPIQARFLVHLLHQREELGRVGRLAEEFGLSRATVSEAVRTLESKGLVRRKLWPGDARVASLRLTPEGEEAAVGLSRWADLIEGQLRSFAPEEKEAVMHFLMRLIAALQRAGVITVARMCVTCRFFRPEAHPESASPHHCALLDQPLSGADLRTDCPEHEPAA